ncbi:MAG TPA: D-2-hydroxyacid dehydrogenase [Longimicrobiales bacterium]|nr:D-2-hydroxyacid dehydrogenase [Longimicrobiales bacterium]
MTSHDRILITSPLEAEHAARIRDAAGSIPVEYHPALLPRARFPADHTGAPLERSPADEARWRELLREATILFDFDPTHRDDLPELAPDVRWVQATSAGIGQFVRRARYAARWPGAVFTTASGVHARPLAEWSLLAMLGHVRGLLHIRDAQSRRHWERFAGSDLEGRTVLVVGMGTIGTEVARLARAFGMTVLGVKRGTDGVDPASLYADELGTGADLHRLLPRADFLVLATPHTDETEGMMGDAELRALAPGAVLINVGRGSLVDEPALVRALTPPPEGTGHLGGAWLDVFATEPLPADSPLWDLPNVVVSPHSASTSDRENARITALFCENLRRDRDGEPLLNVLDTERLY